MASDKQDAGDGGAGPGGAAAAGEARGAAAKRPRSSTPGYGNGPDYWDDRYAKDPNPFEWLEGWAELEELIVEATGGRKDADILHTGCGNSVLPEDMYDAGYRRIVNVDTSAVVIKQMADRNRELRPELQWLVADVTRMTEFADESFDAVLDKSVLDTMACGENAPAVIDAYLRQVLRVLRPDGVMLCVSYSAPASRREYFRQPHLQFTLKEVLIPPRDTAASKHYAYVLRKVA